MKHFHHASLDLNNAVFDFWPPEITTLQAKTTIFYSNLDKLFDLAYKYKPSIFLLDRELCYPFAPIFTLTDISGLLTRIIFTRPKYNENPI